jgi:proton glutamate symport protein
MRKLKLHWQILIALLLAAGFGSILSVLPETNTLRTSSLEACKFVGVLFTNALKMIVVPVIVPSIVGGMIGLGADRNFGRLGMKTLGYYMTTGLIAILTGLLLVNMIQPGKVSPETAAKITANQDAEQAKKFIETAQDRSMKSFAEVIQRMIPANPVKAATDNGQLLGLIVFSLLLGFGISRLPEAQLDTQRKFWESLLAAVLIVTDLIIRLSPIGVFALILPTVAEVGLETFTPLVKFFFTVILGLGIHAFVTLPIIMKFFGLKPTRHFRAVTPAMLTAFSTASSVSTLPVTMDCVEDRAGVSRRISSFTLPLGATVNMDGTALYECVVVIFIAQFYVVTTGIELGFSQQFLVVLMALLTSIGVAGIPSASLVAILVILRALDLPEESIALILVTDRILDMCRTSVNVFSDTCGAAIIAKTEGETLYPDVSEP